MSMSFTISPSPGRLPYHPTSPQGTAAAGAVTAVRRETPAVDASGSQSAASSLSAILGRLGAESRDAPSSAETATPVVRPNLDALNRVLSHYAAQSAGVDTIISLVRS